MQALVQRVGEQGTTSHLEEGGKHILKICVVNFVSESLPRLFRTTYLDCVA